MINLNFQTLVNLINEDILLESEMHSILKKYPGGDKLFRAMAHFHFIDHNAKFKETDYDDLFDEVQEDSIVYVFIGDYGCAAVDVDEFEYDDETGMEVIANGYSLIGVEIEEDNEEKFFEIRQGLTKDNIYEKIESKIGAVDFVYYSNKPGGDHAINVNRKRARSREPLERIEIVNRLYFRVRPILKNNLEPVVTRFEFRAKRFLDAGNFSEVQVILNACKKINTMISDLSSENLKQIPESYKKAFDVAIDEYCQDQGEGLTSQEKNKILEKLLSAGPELKEFLDILRPTLFRYKDIV